MQVIGARKAPDGERQERHMDNYEKTGYLREPFRLFHLEDCPGGEMNLHYHDFYKIIAFYGGCVTYMIEGKSYVLEPGDIVLVNRYDIHKPTIDTAVPYKRSVLYISGECLVSCRDREYDPFYCFSQAAAHKSYVVRLRELAQTEAGQLLRRLETVGQRYGHGREARLLFELFLLSLNRFCRESDREQNMRPAAIYNQKVIDLMAYVQEHLFEEISIDRLAETFYISKYHMMRLFKSETGYTIHRYIAEKRMAAAKEKLLLGVPPTKVSEECGFQDYSTFLRAFKSCVHMTPTAFAEGRTGRNWDGAHSLP